MPRSVARRQIHRTSNVAEDRDLYSASIDDLATVFCFFTDQEIKFGPRKVQNPEIDF
ncbi:hypothetical protein KFK09_003169 [Dendrobium nobile]|uniref:Uncharacterized protein n=1 Tax=Dendrobium nobile TaxID=94219 RepID=A0A8T3C6W6_DENNO|nr:hypothetical protein KFK09_003169 [Dendrobium nobile]